MTKVCDKNITAERKSQVEQHVVSDGHRRKLEFFLNDKHQLFLSECDVTQSTKTFYHDLATAFLSADIPLFKISNPDLKSFLEKYTQKNISSESLLRKSYLKQCYEIVMNKMKERLIERILWISIDETVDSCGRAVGNCVIRILSSDKEQYKSYLINMGVLASTNLNTIAQFFDE